MKYDELVKLAYACAALHQKDALEFVSADDLTKAKQYRQFGDAITALQAELEQCRKDAERLDWLSHSTDSIEYSEVWAAWTDGSTLRCAIDKAMESV